MTQRAAQKECVLARLKQGPATTRDLVVGLNIMRAPARVWELKQEGYPITKREERKNGRRIVTYTLEGHALQVPAIPPNKPVLALQRSETSNQPICLNSACGKAFKPDRKTQRYCSAKCRFEDWDRKNPRLNFATDSQQISTAFADARE